MKQPSCMDSHRLTLLRRKLEALNYIDHLDPSSAPLVQKVVDDLLNTTESYRGLKLQLSRKNQELEDSLGKVGSHEQQVARQLVQVAAESPVLPLAVQCES